MAAQKREISEELEHLKTIITDQKEEIISEISVKVDTNSKNIIRVLEENKELKRENDELKDRVSKIQSAQLSNNIIVTGIPEQPFETCNKTKQHMYYIIIEAIKTLDPSQVDVAMEEVMKLDITYCTRVSKAKLGVNRPISVTFGRRDNEEKIMSIKSKLSQGIYINNKYPLHIKCTRDTLHPIL